MMTTKNFIFGLVFFGMIALAGRAIFGEQPGEVWLAAFWFGLAGFLLGMYAGSLERRTTHVWMDSLPASDWKLEDLILIEPEPVTPKSWRDRQLLALGLRAEKIRQEDLKEGSGAIPPDPDDE
jgi:hypothetical protein